jgi:hypothetical protein
MKCNIFICNIVFEIQMLKLTNNYALLKHNGLSSKKRKEKSLACVSSVWWCCVYCNTSVCDINS